MKIAVTGSTGLVATELIRCFKNQGHTIIRISREESMKKFDEPTVYWDIRHRQLSTDALEDLDVVIHLAGASLADEKWTPAYKEIITSSRVNSTRLICEAMAGLKNPPKVIISASAIGIYGHLDAPQSADESSPAADDFLAHVCQKWEEAAQAAEDKGIRVVYTRFGMILSSRGGGLAEMLPIFQLGLGGKLGSGQQMVSFIALKEIPDIVSHMIQNQQLSGPVNVVTPQAVTNLEFTKTLGSLIHRPTFFPVPAFGARLLFGEMADAILLNGARVLPKKLEETGYTFQYPDIESALKVSLQDELE